MDTMRSNIWTFTEAPYRKGIIQNNIHQIWKRTELRIPRQSYSNDRQPSTCNTHYDKKCLEHTKRVSRRCWSKDGHYTIAKIKKKVNKTENGIQNTIHGQLMIEEH